MRVLIVKPSSLGDILHTFPAVYALQQAFPQLDLSWVVNRSLAEIVEMLPGIDRVIAFPREELGVFKGCSALRSFRRELLAQPYDLALDFQGLLRSALICKFSKAPIRVGFDTAREGAAFFIITESRRRKSGMRWRRTCFWRAATFGSRLPG